MNFFIAVASLLFVATVRAWSVPDDNTGDGTFYQLQAAGNCGYESAPAIGASTVKQLPWTSGIQTFVAINNPQYNNSLTCGQCLVYQGTGPGLGTTPIVEMPTYGFVSDSCPGKRDTYVPKVFSKSVKQTHIKETQNASGKMMTYSTDFSMTSHPTNLTTPFTIPKTKPHTNDTATRMTCVHTLLQKSMKLLANRSPASYTSSRSVISSHLLFSDLYVIMQSANPETWI